MSDGRRAFEEGGYSCDYEILTLTVGWIRRLDDKDFMLFLELVKKAVQERYPEGTVQ